MSRSEHPSEHPPRKIITIRKERQMFAKFLGIENTSL